MPLFAIQKIENCWVNVYGYKWGHIQFDHEVVIQSLISLSSNLIKSYADIADSTNMLCGLTDTIFAINVRQYIGTCISFCIRGYSCN